MTIIADAGAPPAGTRRPGQHPFAADLLGARPVRARSVRARAPLRIGLGGGGTDLSPYCDTYGGNVLNATVSLFAYATITPAPAGTVVFRDVDRDREVAVAADGPIDADAALPLHAGVYRRIMRDYNGGEGLSLTLTTSCDAPAGSGLGSSSTLVVAMVQAFKESLTLPLGEYDVARLAYEIERHDLALQGGRQDQYAACFGGVNFMEFLPDDRVIVNPLRVREEIVAELEASLVLHFTGVSRESAKIIADQASRLSARRAGSIEAMHALKADALAMKERLLRGEIRELGALVGRSWSAKKRTAASISNPEIDRIYDRAIAGGAYAGKISGAGGGGFMLFFVDLVDRPRLMKTLAGEAGYAMTCHFTADGATGWRLRGC